MTVATILIPTFNHAQLIRHSVTSALNQTEADIEIFVVGDGAPPITGEIVTEIAARDPRVRWFENAKGPRHGEVHRARALQEANGEIVTYLADDELYFPEHIETMRRALRSADVATAAVVKPGDDAHTVRVVDLSLSHYRRKLRDGISGSPLSGIAHTAASYRSLPHGWRTTPATIATDRYMLQQFLEAGATFVCSDRPTVLCLPSPESQGISIEEADPRMSRAAAALADPVRRQALLDEISAHLITERPRADARAAGLRARLDRNAAKLVRVRGRLTRARGRIAQYERELARSAPDQEHDGPGDQGTEQERKDDPEPGVVRALPEG